MLAILISLLLLMFFAYRGVAVLILAPLWRGGYPASDMRADS